MAKSENTLKIEQALHQSCREKRLYGCEEVTIGFPNNGYGNEIVDFMSMDSKGIIRCYEIKVSLADLRSGAQLSWYGHYNYLTVAEELYKAVEDWSAYIPDFVGISVLEKTWHGPALVNKRKPVKKKLGPEEQMLVKESLVRTLTWKMWKYQDAADMEKIRKLQKDVRDWKKRYTREYQERLELHRVVQMYRRLTGIDIEDYVDAHKKGDSTCLIK